MCLVRLALVAGVCDLLKLAQVRDVFYFKASADLVIISCCW